MSVPKISVAMGVKYGDEDISLLERAVKSILEQSCGDFEFLICVKESSEIAMKFLEETAKNDERIVLIDGSKCNHLGGQLNRCIERSHGEYIARMDDDDFSVTERFIVQLKFLETHEDFAFVGSNVRLIRGGQEVGFRELPERPEVRDFLFVQPFIHPTLMFRKSALEAVGGYSDGKDQRGCEDYDLLMRLYHAGFKGANIQEFLLDYTLPVNGKKHRKFGLRVNETKTRFSLYKKMGLMPKALPYAVKPVAVGLLPSKFVEFLKVGRNRKNERKSLDDRRKYPRAR